MTVAPVQTKPKVLIDDQVRCCNCQWYREVPGQATGLCGNFDPLQARQAERKAMVHRNFGCVNFTPIQQVIQAKRQV